MGVFVSEFEHSLDPKRRLTIPAEWRLRSRESNSLYVLPDHNYPCLIVFPESEMQRRIESIRGHSIADRKARQFARMLGSSSDLVAWDSQGRIRIKDALLDRVGLVNQVTLVGAFAQFELWNPDKLKLARQAEGEADFEEAARYVGF